jgi:hypothetical protein
MSKKSRRARAKSHTTERSQPKQIIQRTEPVRKKVESSAAVAKSGAPSLTLAQQNRYYYIVPELRRIAIIAGSLIVVLIILTFILG